MSKWATAAISITASGVGAGDRDVDSTLNGTTLSYLASATTLGNAPSRRLQDNRFGGNILTHRDRIGNGHGHPPRPGASGEASFLSGVAPVSSWLKQTRSAKSNE